MIELDKYDSDDIVSWIFSDSNDVINNSTKNKLAQKFIEQAELQDMYYLLEEYSSPVFKEHLEDGYHFICCSSFEPDEVAELTNSKVIDLLEYDDDFGTYTFEVVISE